MKGQILQVFRTYTRRPLVRMIAAVAVLVTLGLFANGMGGGGANLSIEPRIQRTGDWAWIDPGEWEGYFLEHRASDLTGLQIVDQSGADFPDLTPLVNLTALQLSSHDFSGAKLEEVDSLEDLQALSLQAPAIPEGMFSRLGPKLRQLEIPLRLLLSRGDEVPQLVELRVLRVDRYGLTSLTPEAMAVIAQIPNLETLVLSPQLNDVYDGVGGSQPGPVLMELTGENLRPLAGHPALEAIFADSPAPASPSLATLPGVRLYSASVSRSWSTAMFLSFFLTTAIAVLVAAQAWAHFTVQNAAVIPGYARPHRWAAIIVLLGGSLIGAVGLWLSGIALLPGSAIALGLPTAIVTTFSTSQSQSSILRTLGRAPIFLIPVLLWVPIALTVTLPPQIAGELVWFLRGGFSVVAVAILVGEAVLLKLAFDHLSNLTRRVYETSALRPGLSPWDPQQQRRSTYGSNERRRSLPKPGERYGHLGGASNWQKARLWRAGNALRPRNAFMFGGVFVVFFVAMQVVMRGGAGLSEPTVWVSCMAQLTAFALLLPAAAWYQRSRHLQVESLRPVNRKQLVRQLFTALAVDQSLALLPLAIALALWIVFPRDGGSVAESYSFAAVGLAALVWAYALSTAVFAIQRDWILVGYAIGMTVLPIMAAFTIGITADEAKMPAGQQIALIYLLALAMLGLALGVLSLTYRRSLRREWG